MPAINDPAQIIDLLAQAQLAAWHDLLASYPLGRLIDTTVQANRESRARNHANPLLRHGAKYFSQNDEDGILLEICRRIGLSGGSFLEFGIGHGLENNTLILLMSGWSGGWVDAEPLAFDIPAGTRQLAFEKSWVTADNALQIHQRLANRISAKSFDLISIDLDGNDLHVLQKLLDNDVRPAVFIVEYNGKFPPPIRFQIKYNAAHRFAENDYYGASLQSFCDLLPDYQLVACNITGVNAFFVHERFAAAFADVPTRPDALFVAADYATVTRIGHPPAAQTILSFLNQ